LDTHTLLLAKDDENVVGCVFFTPVNETDVYFGRLSVLPAYQNQGIASQLLACVEAYAADNGYKRVTLAVRIVLADNVRYFQSLGYQITSKESHEGFTEPTYYTMAKMITLP
jgi:predicted N-acetyltransferase YhbS